MQQDFAQLAADFQTRVRSANLPRGASVVLVCHLENEAGERLPGLRLDVTPGSVLLGDETPEELEQHRQLLIEGTCCNIQCELCNRLDQPALVYERQAFPLRVVDFDLEIFLPPSN